MDTSSYLTHETVKNKTGNLNSRMLTWHSWIHISPLLLLYIDRRQEKGFTISIPRKTENLGQVVIRSRATGVSDLNVFFQDVW